MTTVVEFVDDPSLPCGYCCGYVDNPDEMDLQDPYLPVDIDGVLLTRLHSKPHRTCSQSVAAYVDENPS